MRVGAWSNVAMSSVPKSMNNSNMQAVKTGTQKNNLFNVQMRNTASTYSRTLHKASLAKSIGKPYRINTKV